MNITTSLCILVFVRVSLPEGIEGEANRRNPKYHPFKHQPAQAPSCQLAFSMNYIRKKMAVGVHVVGAVGKDSFSQTLLLNYVPQEPNRASTRPCAIGYCADFFAVAISLRS